MAHSCSSSIQHNERLEFLGDAILEFICTCHLYFLFPDMAEGGLVTHRSSLVQNKHLAQVAKVTVWMYHALDVNVVHFSASNITLFCDCF